MTLKKILVASTFCFASFAPVFTQTNKVITIKANEPGVDIASTMYGVFFEDINMGADGGVYAEMIKNRSFEFRDPWMGWNIEQKPYVEGAVRVQNRREINAANPRFLTVTVNNTTKGNLVMINEGFRGMGVRQGLRYDFSFMYRQPAAGIKFVVALVNPKGEEIGGTTVIPTGIGADWKKMAVSFNATATEEKAQLKISIEGNGSIDLDMISLFPEDTWKKRPGGMRADMVQLLADMKPGFIRFPGGCIVEGHDLSNRYQWKKTIGPIEERQLIVNRWNFEFDHRKAPDYFQTFGLGFFEYFQLAEDVGAEPLPILNCGMACQFNSGELVMLDQLDPYVQDALDLIEFANGDVNTVWGKVRASMGHPAPFNLKFMGVGNENWGPQYLERLEIFQKAIKAKYPNFNIIGSAGPDPSGERFDLLNQNLRRMKIDLIDEHYYRGPQWFLKNATRYDSYPRNEVKIFAGEYAAHSDYKLQAEARNTWHAALCEAAFMTGLERNADVVKMASYAPLFAHAEAWQWNPDLIWVNNLNIVGSASYQVQKLFSVNKGTKTVPVTMNNNVVAGTDSLYASATINAATNELIIKVVNVSGNAQTTTLQIDGIKKLDTNARQSLLQNDNLMAYNTFANPLMVAPAENVIKFKGNKIEYNALPYSVSFFSIKMK